jgi:ankyrin repeat protein
MKKLTSLLFTFTAILGQYPLIFRAEAAPALEPYPYLPPSSPWPDSVFDVLSKSPKKTLDFILDQLQNGKDINAVSNSKNLTLLQSVLYLAKQGNVLTPTMSEILIRKLLSWGADSKNASATLMRDTIGKNLPSSHLNFALLQILLDHNPELVNEKITQDDGYPLAIAIILKNPVGLDFLLNQTHINLNIKEPISHMGCLSLFLINWAEVDDVIKIPLLKKMLKKRAPIYDREHYSPNPEPIELAVANYQEKAIKLLARYGATLNYDRRYKMSPLMYALRANYTMGQKIPFVKRVLALGASINNLTTEFMESPPIDHGISSNAMVPLFYPMASPLYMMIVDLRRDPSTAGLHRELINFLLENGADPNIPSTTKNNKTQSFPLHKAVSYKDAEVVKWLMHHFADPLLRDQEGNTAFDLADEKMQLLLKSATPWLDDYLKTRICIILCAVGPLILFLQNRDIVGLTFGAIILLGSRGMEETILKPVTQNFSVSLGISSLIFTACAIKTLIGLSQTAAPALKTETSAPEKKPARSRRKTSTSNRDEEEKPIASLFEACQTGNIQRVEACIAEKQNLNQVDVVSGMTPLHTACKHGKLVVVKRLLKVRFVRINSSDAKGNTPILLAADQKHWKIVSLLLKWEAVAQSPKNKRLLNLTMQDLQYNVFQKILTHSPLINREQLLWQTLSCALQSESKATEEGREDRMNAFIENLIAKYPNTVHYVDPASGKTPLMLACEAGHTMTVKALLKKGTHVNVRDVVGKSAFNYAESLGDPKKKSEILKMLREYGATSSFKQALSKLGINNPPKNKLPVHAKQARFRKS